MLGLVVYSWWICAQTNGPVSVRATTRRFYSFSSHRRHLVADDAHFARGADFDAVEWTLERIGDSGRGWLCAPLALLAQVEPTSALRHAHRYSSFGVLASLI
jgi:hypothetical protein